MKKLIAVLLLLSVMIPAAVAEGEPSRVLVAYLSRAGENYNVGIPQAGSASAAYAGYIEKGNTAMMAAVIADMTGGDLFEIQTVTPYPEDYASMLRVAQEEIDTDARPALAANVENMADYEVVFIGYPNWWGTMPMFMFTLLDAFDWTGKKIVPFCTNEGSGLGSSERDIKASCPEQP